MHTCEVTMGGPKKGTPSPKRKTQEQFLIDAEKAHGNSYDYAKTIYSTADTKVTISCKKHGDFLQTPIIHIRGHGCLKCGRLKITMTTDEFIIAARKVHGNRYNYNKTIYKNAKTKVIIICSKHGEFKTMPQSHVALKTGCPKCYGRLKTNDDFISEAEIIHNNQYDYSLTNYRNASIKIKILCNIHGEFMQAPRHHLDGAGCDKCNREKYNAKRRWNTEIFIKKAKQIHGDKYNYANTQYITNKKKIAFKCGLHGIIYQTPLNHLLGRGCHICKESSGENIIARLLKEKSVNYEREKTFSGCRDKKLLRFDFYLPKYNICIEFDGMQHYKPIELFGGKDGFVKTQRRDKIKNEYCKDSGVYLYRIKYGHNIKETLNEILWEVEVA